jgi:two-component system, OmpR family, response regulator
MDSMKLLIVEDEHRIAASLKKGFEQERFTVDVAYTGTEGFDLASTEQYDCIILDLMLPGLNGIDVCKNLRKDNNHTPILMLTAKGQLEDKVTGLNCGADDYMTKPFAFEELLARVKALSRRPATTVSADISVGTLHLNTQTYQVTRNGKSILLSNKEFSILEYLMRHPGQILTKEQIIEHVWDYESDVLPNIVEVNIRNLRKKIDHPFSSEKPLIQTVRGFGYKIEI